MKESLSSMSQIWKTLDSNQEGNQTVTVTEFSRDVTDSESDGHPTIFWNPTNFFLQVREAR
jgi:hypothetical protein